MVAMIAVGMVLGGYFMFMTSHEAAPRPSGPRFSPGPRERVTDGRKTMVAEGERKTERGPGPPPEPRPEPEPNSSTDPNGATVTLRGERSELETPVGAWTKFKADEQDEQGDLFLRSGSPKEKDEALRDIKSATVLVVVLDKTEASLQAAADMVRARLEKQRQAEDKAYKLVPASDRPPAESERVGDGPGRIVEFKLQKGEEPRKYVLLAVVNGPDALYAIRCECNWEYRQVWQQAFRDLVRSFRARKKNEES